MVLLPARTKIKPGAKFGKWTVLGKSPQKRPEVYWVCQCECGSVRSVRATNLRRGDSLSCRCNMKLLGLSEDLAGGKFGNLVAICRDRKRKSHRPYWVTYCNVHDCYTSVRADSLKQTKGCGCRLNTTKKVEWPLA